MLGITVTVVFALEDFPIICLENNSIQNWVNTFPALQGRKHTECKYIKINSPLHISTYVPHNIQSNTTRPQLTALPRENRKYFHSDFLTDRGGEGGGDVSLFFTSEKFPYLEKLRLHV
jgi:hypothetical protein